MSKVIENKNEDPQRIKRLVFWQCRASKLSVKLSGKRKNIAILILSPISGMHTDTYTETETQTHNVSRRAEGGGE